MKRDIRLSIIIPTHNVGQYIEQCLLSILDQDSNNIEVIIIDDASTDNTKYIIEQFEKNYSNCKAHYRKQRGGPGICRNVGLEICQGDYIQFVDSDDFLKPLAIETILEEIVTHSPDLMIFNHAYYYEKNDIYLDGSTKYTDRWLRQEENNNKVDKSPLFYQFVVAWNKIYNRSFIERNNYSFESGYYEDITWTYPILMESETIRIIPTPLYCYRIRKGSILNSSDSQHFDIFLRYNTLFNIIKNSPNSIYKSVIYDRMASHYIGLLDRQSHRLPSKMIKPFFIKAASVIIAMDYKVPKDQLFLNWQEVERKSALAIYSYLQSNSYLKYRIYITALTLIRIIRRINDKLLSYSPN